MVGILYESDEWSDWKLARELKLALGEAVTMINMEKEGALEAALSCDFLTRVELIDGTIALVVKRSIAPSGLSSYHEGSTYELYPDCPASVKESVLAAGRKLGIRFGSFDVIEGADGRAYVIDANSVSNVSEDCTELFGFDLMKEYAIALARIIRNERDNQHQT